MIKGCIGAQLRNVFTNEVTICDHDVCPQCFADRHFFDHIFLQCPQYSLPGNRFKIGGTLKLIHLSHYQKV